MRRLDQLISLYIIDVKPDYGQQVCTFPEIVRPVITSLGIVLVHASSQALLRGAKPLLLRVLRPRIVSDPFKKSNWIFPLSKIWSSCLQEVETPQTIERTLRCIGRPTFQLYSNCLDLLTRGKDGFGGVEKEIQDTKGQVSGQAPGIIQPIWSYASVFVQQEETTHRASKVLLNGQPE